MAEARSFFGRNQVTLFHGSARKVKHPAYGIGNPNNDYGLGFYTTELKELAFEWACPRANDGWANGYLLDTRGLSIVDLNADCYTVLNWMAVLLEHRKVSMSAGIAREARDFIVKEYAVDLTGADLVHGYRADDSYFHIARSFLNNTIPVEVLEQALFLGGLGYQVAIMSERAFSQLTWIAAEPASGTTWNPRRITRDAEARAIAAQLTQSAATNRDGTYILDIMRGDASWQR